MNCVFCFVNFWQILVIFSIMGNGGHGCVSRDVVMMFCDRVFFRLSCDGTTVGFGKGRFETLHVIYSTNVIR